MGALGAPDLIELEESTIHPLPPPPPPPPLPFVAKVTLEQMKKIEPTRNRECDESSRDSLLREIRENYKRKHPFSDENV